MTAVSTHPAPSPKAPPQTLRLPDGRTLAWRSTGDPAGLPALYFNGWPSSSLEAGLGHGAALQAGIRLIGVDRPGFGASSPPTTEAPRSLLGFSADVAALLDALGIERCGIAAVSGGATYALACAAALPQHIAAVSCMSGLGRVDQPEGLRRMSLLGRIFLPFAQRNPGRFATLLRPASILARAWPCSLGWLITHLGASAADRAAVRALGVAPLLSAMIAQALGQGSQAAAEELATYTQPWGFAMDAVRQPVDWWHGSADPVVPLALAEWTVAQLPNGRLHPLMGEGHFSAGLHHGEAALLRLREQLAKKVEGGEGQ